ncbi:MAG: hypothetical protein QNK23_04040 [Crocinitomicaceae bacterium]|nr:hypothetical protein [Crocinitomicaceae bacterium]
MVNRILLSIILLASLAWIGYVSSDILSENNNYSPEFLFGEQDGQLLIINRSGETDLYLLEDFMTAPMTEMEALFTDNQYETGYLSSLRSHAMFTKTENWTEENIRVLLSNQNTGLTFNGNSFKFGEFNEFEGRFYKKNLYIHSGKIELNQSPVEYLYDKKSSASIIKFGTGNTVETVSDIYFKADGQVNYVTYNDNIEQGNQVKDEVVFASTVTKNFSAYHFYERDYYGTLDSTFVQGPMSKWIQNGFLELEYNGSTVIITDYIMGQDPILILNDINQTYDTSIFNIPLTATFPSSGKSYHIKYLEDLVVLSESESACDGVVADYKLGNTIALDQTSRAMIYGALPSSVSERIVTEDKSYSRAVYRGKILETLMGAPSVRSPENTVQRESLAFNCGFDIRDFVTLSGEGNLVALGKNGELVRFKNGDVDWKQANGESPIGKLQIIDLHENGEKFILYNTETGVHLIDLAGNYHSGFPIDLEQDATNEVKFYRWKGKSFFLLANDENKVMHFDSKGRELNIISSNINIDRQIDVWASQGKLFAGFTNGAQFAMYNMDKNEMHREFQMPTSCIPVKIPNELIQFGLRDKRLVKVDQKGTIFEFMNFERAKLIDVVSDNKTVTIIVQSANEIHLLNSEGIPFSQIKLPFNEVEDVFIHTINSGKTVIAVIDGLENNVYLYGLDGALMSQTPLEGQTKVVINSTGSNLIISAVVDQYIVQYFE